MNKKEKKCKKWFRKVFFQIDEQCIFWKEYKTI